MDILFDAAKWLLLIFLIAVLLHRVRLRLTGRVVPTKGESQSAMSTYVAILLLVLGVALIIRGSTGHYDIGRPRGRIDPNATYHVTEWRGGRVAREYNTSGTGLIEREIFIGLGFSGFGGLLLWAAASKRRRNRNRETR
jgi:hypothetical protein